MSQNCIPQLLKNQEKLATLLEQLLPLLPTVKDHQKHNEEYQNNITAELNEVKKAVERILDNGQRSSSCPSSYNSNMLNPPPYEEVDFDMIYRRHFKFEILEEFFGDIMTANINLIR